MHVYLAKYCAEMARYRPLPDARRLSRHLSHQNADSGESGMARYVLRTPIPRARRLWHPVGCACRLQIQSAEEGAVTIDLNREAGKVRAEGAKLAGGAGSATARIPSATWRATFY